MNLSQQMNIERLNAETREERLDALREIKARTDAGELPAPERTDMSTTTFTRYTAFRPIRRPWQLSRVAVGVCTAGIMDHDSVSGVLEFIEAGEIIGMPTTIGCECRVDMSNTSVAGRRINNPDQDSVAYVAMHGIPHQNIYVIDAFFEKYRRYRNERNYRMCKKIDELMKPYGVSLDFKRDVLPLSCAWEGGSVTDAHSVRAREKADRALSDAGGAGRVPRGRHEASAFR